jgi:dipeptide/tripeptide permease
MLATIIYILMKEKEDKRRPFAGMMVLLLYFSKKAMMVIGALLIAIGFIGGFYFGSIVVNQASQGKLNPVTSSPYPVNGIDPLLAEKVFIAIAVIGLAILGLGLASRSRYRSNLAKLK